MIKTCQKIVKAVCAHVDTSDLRAIAVASIGEEGFFLDTHGRPLYPSFAWFEHRVGPSFQLWADQHPDAQFRTGLSLKPTYSLFKWLWLRENFPALWTKAEKWVGMSDYVSYLLSGSLMMSFSQATRTYVFDPREHDWISSWVNEVLPKGLNTLPKLVSTGSVIGYTSARVKEQWGLPEGIAVVAGGHDHPIGAIGAGVTDPSKMLDSMGTAELIYWPTLQLSDSRVEGLEYGYTGYARGPFYQGAGTYTGMTIKTLCRLLQVDFQNLRHLNPGTLTVSPQIWVLPNRLGEPAFFDLRGVSSDIAADDILLAALRASAMVVRAAQNSMSRIGDTKPLMIAIGGGAIPTALQIKADVLQSPIYTINGLEVVAIGAAKVAQQAFSAGAIYDIPYDIYYPNATMESYYEDMFGQFLQRWAPAVGI
jgi:xylulokinase